MLPALDFGGIQEGKLPPINGWREENRKWESPRGGPLLWLLMHFISRIYCFYFLPLCPIECVKYSQDKIKQKERTKKQSPNQSWKGLYNITIIRLFIGNFRNEHYFITIRG